MSAGTGSRGVVELGVAPPRGSRFRGLYNGRRRRSFVGLVHGRQRALVQVPERTPGGIGMVIIFHGLPAPLDRGGSRDRNVDPAELKGTVGVYQFPLEEMIVGDDMMDGVFGGGQKQ